MLELNPNRIALSNIDSVFLGQQPVPVQMVFLFPGGLDPDLLASSLKRVMPIFWPLFGELDLSDALQPHVARNPNLPFALSCAPPLDFAWPWELDLNQLAKDALPPDTRVLAPPAETKTLFAAQITPLKTGGALLGVSMSHAIVDGFSFFYFLDQWARASRNEEILHPNHDRKLHSGIPIQRRFLEDVSPEEFLEMTGFFCENPPPLASENPFLKGEACFDWETLTLSEEDLRRISNAYSSEDGVRRSLNDLLCEFLFRRFGPDTGYLAIPVDVRRLSSRLKEVKHNYFGNGIRPVTLKVSQYDAPGSISQRVGNEVRRLRTERIEETLQFLASLRTQTGLPPHTSYKVMDPKTGLLVTNLSRLPLNSLLFGRSAPNDLRILTPMFGAAVILPSPVPNESLIQVSKRLLT